jgi:hypothetical protein
LRLAAVLVIEAANRGLETAKHCKGAVEMERAGGKPLQDAAERTLNGAAIL